ncbi:MAG: LysR family transcriptional regulator [Rhodospirillaceae bacterium]|nr:LysR family transcriptional regulator [Rhodospirillaceae bacterium]
MELRHIRYFLAVAEERNFTRAAAKVGIGQPPLSQQIRALEREIGAPLFHRVPQGAELTEAGEAFLERARSILIQAEDAKRVAQRAARGEIGRLRVGFSGSAAFNPVVPAPIRSFRRAYPAIDLSLMEVNTVKLIELLHKEDIDVAFIRPAVEDPPGLILHRFLDEPMLVAVPSAHPLALAGAVSLAALEEEPFVLYPRTVGLGLYEEVMTHCRAVGFEPHVAIDCEPELAREAPQMASVINLVAAEVGISIVPRSMTQLSVPGVTFVPLDGLAPVARLACAMRRGERAVAARNFMALAVDAGNRQRARQG